MVRGTQRLSSALSSLVSERGSLALAVFVPRMSRSQPRTPIPYPFLNQLCTSCPAHRRSHASRRRFARYNACCIDPKPGFTLTDRQRPARLSSQHFLSCPISSSSATSIGRKCQQTSGIGAAAGLAQTDRVSRLAAPHGARKQCHHRNAVIL